MFSGENINRFSAAWAKLAPISLRALPLGDHGGDVAAVIKKLLFETGALGDLSPQEIERLQVLAFLHDLGKCNRGFWARQFAGTPMIGHTSVTATLFHHFNDVAPVVALVDMLRDWDCDELFIAVMAHHGKPLEVYACQNPNEQMPIGILDRIQNDASWWQAKDGYDPISQLNDLVKLAKTRFPLAFEAGPPLSKSPEKIAFFCGLVTLADWLGSDTVLFPVERLHHENRYDHQEAASSDAIKGRGLHRTTTPPGKFADAFYGWSPQGVQIESGQTDLGDVALFEAETGAGKTEAAIWHWLELRRAGLVDGLYFALPTQSAAVQLHKRVQKALDSVFGSGVHDAVLAVPGYLQAGDAQGQALPHFEVVWPDDRQSDARWAAESPKRFLTARIAVGTIDQALMAGLKIKHAHFRLAAMARNLLVVDEVHASDAFMTEALKRVIRNHRALGGRALLLSATLSSDARADLLGHAPLSLADACSVPYPSIAGIDREPMPVEAIPDARQKDVALHPCSWINDPEEIAGHAVKDARAGASVLIIRNSVAGAIAVAKAIEALDPALCFRVNGVATLHHGRFAPSDRKLQDAEVEIEFGKNRTAVGRIIVGTQTLEQSLDIDADLLITDLAPIDVLLQRIGRLHRHQRADRGNFTQARAIVLTPKERDLSRLLGKVKDRHGLGPMRDGSGAYPDLLAIEATLRLIEANPVASIPADNRRLVEGALHRDVKSAISDELGVAWSNHANMLDGRDMSDRGLARHWSLDISDRFTSLIFPDAEEAISTRLGLKNRIVDLPDGPTGPLGKTIFRLTIPGWMSVGLPENANPVIVTASHGIIIFTLGNKQFRYDRFGLTGERV